MMWFKVQRTVEPVLLSLTSCSISLVEYWLVTPFTMYETELEPSSNLCRQSKHSETQFKVQKTQKKEFDVVMSKLFLEEFSLCIF